MVLANRHAEQQSDNCYSTRKVEAWIANKGEFRRCFLEGREYPNRVRGYNLDGDSEDLLPSRSEVESNPT